MAQEFDLRNVAFRIRSSKQLEGVLKLLRSQGEPVYREYGLNAYANYVCFGSWRYLAISTHGTWCGAPSRSAQSKVVIEAGDLFDE